MKNKLRNSLIILGLAFGVGTAVAATPTHFTERGITGTYLCVSNSASYSSTSSNFYYYSYALGTNVQVGVTNSLGNQVPNPIADLPLFPDAYVEANQNLAVQVVVGYTNQLFLAGVQSPVLLNTVWTNPAPFFNVSVQTNLTTFIFTPVSSGDFSLADSGGKSWTVTVGSSNGLPNVASFNVPTNIIAGAYALRVTATNSSTGTGSGVIVNAINLTGWKP